MTTPENEYRSATVENRSTEQYRRIGGIGVPYGKRSRLLPGGFYEVVSNRALAKTLGDKANVVSRLEHHPEWLLGSTAAGTMRLRDDPNVGLDYEVDLPPTTAGNDCYELTKRGDLRNASMGFVAYEQEFRHEGAVLVRHLLSIKLTEISPTSTPAYADTHTALRHLAVQVGEDPEDIFELARRKELRSLFARTDVQSAPASQDDHGLDVARKRLELQRIKPAIDSGEPCYDHGDHGLDVRRRRLELQRMEWEFAESRSLTDDFPTDVNGHAIHWHPARW